MPKFAISQSMLVNRGLNAVPSEASLINDPDGGDAVGSFKQLIASDRVQISDTALSGLFGTIQTLDQLASFAIKAKYAELGGKTGLLGATSGGLVALGIRNGYSQACQNGTIYWQAACGAHAIFGPIAARWAALGGVGGSFGYPLSDVHCGDDPRGAGWLARFAGGSIYWVPPPATATPTTSAPPVRVAVAGRIAPIKPILLDTGRADAFATGGLKFANENMLAAVTNLAGINNIANTFEVHGGIHAKYLALGAEASFLGYPRTDETGTPDGIGRFNHFQGGSIYWTPTTGAHEVHGLIRDFWAQQGWERNPALGYPISDELIPDRRIGNRLADPRKKPFADLPPDIIKLPAEAPGSTVPQSAALAAALRARQADRLAAAAVAMGTSASALASGATAVATAGDLGTVALNPNIDLSVFVDPPQSTASSDVSRNRFGDFEGGVLFWFRDATAAIALSPKAKTADGTILTFTGADIARQALGSFGTALQGPNMTPTGLAFVGTTPCSNDGVQVHNRRHRLMLSLIGQDKIGPFGMSMPVTAAAELRVEVWFEPAARKIVLALTDWSLSSAASGSYGETVQTQLRARLDPLLWSQRPLATLPADDGGKPIAVLAVKTLADGTVATFVEPNAALVVAPGIFTTFQLIPNLFVRPS